MGINFWTIIRHVLYLSVFFKKHWSYVFFEKWMIIFWHLHQRITFTLLNRTDQKNKNHNPPPKKNQIWDWYRDVCHIQHWLFFFRKMSRQCASRVTEFLRMDCSFLVFFSDFKIFNISLQLKSTALQTVKKGITLYFCRNFHVKLHIYSFFYRLTTLLVSLWH